MRLIVWERYRQGSRDGGVERMEKPERLAGELIGVRHRNAIRHRFPRRSSRSPAYVRGSCERIRSADSIDQLTADLYERSYTLLTQTHERPLVDSRNEGTWSGAETQEHKHAYLKRERWQRVHDFECPH